MLLHITEDVPPAKRCRSQRIGHGGHVLIQVEDPRVLRRESEARGATRPPFGSCRHLVIPFAGLAASPRVAERPDRRSAAVAAHGCTHLQLARLVGNGASARETVVTAARHDVREQPRPPEVVQEPAGQERGATLHHVAREVEGIGGVELDLIVAQQSSLRGLAIRGRRGERPEVGSSLEAEVVDLEPGRGDFVRGRA